MGTPATANDYAVLGLRPSASLTEVEEAFQRLSLENHPDRSANPRAGDRFQAIVQAYDRIRTSGSGRVYRVGEAQPEDDIAPRPSGDFIPFEQAAWKAPELAPTFMERTTTARMAILGALSAIALVFALVFLVTRLGSDGQRISQYDNSPTCAANEHSKDCVVSGLSAQVDGTLQLQTGPFFGGYADGLRLFVYAHDIDVGVSKDPTGAAYGGWQFNDNAQVILWRGEVVGVSTADGGGELTTDATPQVVADRHMTDALAWLAVAAVFAIRPALWFHKRQRTRAS